MHRTFLYLLGLTWIFLLGISLNFGEPYFRPWERALSDEGKAFRPNLEITGEECGDLAHRLSIPSLRTWRKAAFSTDAHGYRSPEVEGIPEVVILGDSFVAGSGLQDHQTLTARLHELTRKPICNLACQGGGVTGPDRFLTDPRWQSHAPRWVIWMPSYRAVGPTKPPRKPKRMSVTRWGRRLKEHLERDNGLAHLSRDIYRQLTFDLFGHQDVVQYAGERTLRFPRHEQNISTSFTADDKDRTLRSVLSFHHTLAARGIRLLYAPIPEAATMHPDLYDPPLHQDELDRSLPRTILRLARDADVSVLDLKELWAAHSTKPYLFLRDDTHWSPATVALTARLIAGAIAQ